MVTISENGESRNRGARCSAPCRNGTTIKMVGTTFYRLSSQWLGTSMMTDDRVRQRSLYVYEDHGRRSADRRSKGGRTWKTRRHTTTTNCDHHLHVVSRDNTGNGMRERSGGGGSSTSTTTTTGEGCTLGDPAGFLPSHISAGDYVAATCLRDERRVLSHPQRLSATKVAIDQYFSKKTPACERDECEKTVWYEPTTTTATTTIAPATRRFTRRCTCSSRSSNSSGSTIREEARYVAGTPGKSRLHHPPSSLPSATLPGVFLSLLLSSLRVTSREWSRGSIPNAHL